MENILENVTEKLKGKIIKKSAFNAGNPLCFYKDREDLEAKPLAILMLNGRL
ncbi:MAG: Unknown protein [uncultured Sulfurovum sp.]|uniref:Uncharacterized protein n=1 Tax=uncultured Sulfurovum sp. TaxID=269237 RepID=A0A6S6STN7_9BACT|nr:MAG: Unknown protein [uncultured Sulfurovum sp.]